MEAQIRNGRFCAEKHGQNGGRRFLERGFSTENAVGLCFVYCMETQLEEKPGFARKNTGKTEGECS